MDDKERESWLRRLQLERHLIMLKSALSCLIEHVEAGSKGLDMREAIDYGKGQIKAAEAMQEETK